MQSMILISFVNLTFWTCMYFSPVFALHLQNPLSSSEVSLTTPHLFVTVHSKILKILLILCIVITLLSCLSIYNRFIFHLREAFGYCQLHMTAEQPVVKLQWLTAAQKIYCRLMLLSWSLHSCLMLIPALVPESFLSMFFFFQLGQIDTFAWPECYTCLDRPFILNLGIQDRQTTVHHLIKDFGAGVFPVREGHSTRT